MSDEAAIARMAIQMRQSSEVAEPQLKIEEDPGPDLILCHLCGQYRIQTEEDIGGPCEECKAKPVVVQGVDWPEVRHRRNLLISDCDYTQLPDSVIDSVRDAFIPWRQALRDVTDMATPAEAWVALDELQANRPTG